MDCLRPATGEIRIVCLYVCTQVFCTSGLCPEQREGNRMCLPVLYGCLSAVFFCLCWHMWPAIYIGIYILCVYTGNICSVLILDRPWDTELQQPCIYQATRVHNSFQQVKDHQISLNQFLKDSIKNLTFTDDAFFYVRKNFFQCLTGIYHYIYNWKRSKVKHNTSLPGHGSINLHQP